MKNLTSKLMKHINKSIMDNDSLNKVDLVEMIEHSKVDREHKLALLKIIDIHSQPSILNKHIFDYNSNLEQQAKHEKFMAKFKNQENAVQLMQDFDKYKDYIYSLVSTKSYKSKMAKSKVKVKLHNLQNLYGADQTEMFNDLIQEGKLYLWEGLKKFGVLPEKGKNFNNRLNEGYERHLSSKSTFLFSNLVRSLINLGKKANSDKYFHLDVEFKPEILGDNEED